MGNITIGTRMFVSGLGLGSGLHRAGNTRLV